MRTIGTGRTLRVRMVKRKAANVRLFRYKTTAIVGPWRRSRREAVEDALRARQAWYDPGKAGELTWLVPGEIEESSVSGAHAT